MAKSKKKSTTLELKSLTFDPINLEPISQVIESKNPNEEGSLQNHRADGFAVTTELIKQIIDALKKG